MKKLIAILVVAVSASIAATEATGYVIDQGGAGCWTWTGNSSNEVMPGSVNPDCMFGYGGNDTLYGGAGADQIFGNGGPDTMYGGTEVDDIYGGPGYDTAYGGDGNDRIYMDDGGLDSQIDCGAGADDTLVLDTADTGVPFDRCEHVILQLSPQHNW